MKELTRIPEYKLLKIVDLSPSKFSNWKKGVNPKPKRIIPKIHYSTPEERQKVIEFKREHMNLGYRLLAWIMVDLNIVALSPSTVYRILKKAGLSKVWTNPPGEPKKKGFDQPTKPHEHWHTDISYVRYKGTRFYLICILDGFSRAILAWDIRLAMESFDTYMVLIRACLKWLPTTEINPRLISDNGSQFLTKEYKAILHEFEMTHVRTSVNHPQSNGKIERFHKTIKNECVRDLPRITEEQFRRDIGEWIRRYNEERLHSSIQYLPPIKVLSGQGEEILQERKNKIAIAKMNRELYYKKVNANAENSLQENCSPNFAIV